MPKWEYGGAYKRYPVSRGESIRFQGGSQLTVHDIFFPLPSFMKTADVVFTDSPWNVGNMKSFYTKAEIPFPDIKQFSAFYTRLFECIKEIHPRVCYLEIGKEFLSEFILEMRKLYKYVTFYNSTYYHKKTNICYVVQGSDTRKNWHYDWMDEEDIINEVAKNEVGVIGDLCMGRGLVAIAAAKNGKQFVGTELNPKRLAVCLESLGNIGVKRIG